ncbi:Transcriptional coactivator Hfi1/Transcriptional adapter 1 [Artemisia annua]|uniref:Transcriptional coactivator Hfi1/Transcriptional adapter 1 n=1 Tax=Artemisia annua TaxID=35608 RepID=A0A2U1LDP7_ARTAN|nr:Transcriptional coactivator Hfi1/Transcriptional adapter 1 [Artemisia annua]
MPAVQHCSRVDTIELKVEMERRLGTQKAEKYFNLLTRYLSLKGNRNLISIVRNAVVCKTPPLAKQVKRDGVNGIDPRNGLQSLCRDVFLNPSVGENSRIVMCFWVEEIQDRPEEPNPLFEKILTATDTGKSRWLVLPKNCAEVGGSGPSEPTSVARQASGVNAVGRQTDMVVPFS